MCGLGFSFVGYPDGLLVGSGLMFGGPLCFCYCLLLLEGGEGFRHLFGGFVSS